MPTSGASISSLVHTGFCGQPDSTQGGTEPDSNWSKWQKKSIVAIYLIETMPAPPSIATISTTSSWL